MITAGKRALRIIADPACLALALALAFLLRFEGTLPPLMARRFVLLLPYVVACQYIALLLFDIPRVSWRYFSLRDARQVVLAFACSSSVLMALRLVLPLSKSTFLSAYGVVPFSVIVLDAGIALVGTVALRSFRRTLAETAERSAHNPTTNSPNAPLRTLLIGAGQAGAMTAREIIQRPDLGIRPIGFLDDDRATHATTVYGIRVLGAIAALGEIAKTHRADQVLITMANARGPEVRRVRELCEVSGLGAKIVPGIHEFMEGSVNLSSIRDVAIEDLLGRDPVLMDESNLFEALAGAVVLVTGAGGSIGSELCRQALRFRPRRLVLVDNSENNLFNIHRELARSAGTVELIPLVASVTDTSRMTTVFEVHRPDVVLHAAAYKHVPMMEWNPAQAVVNNCLGTRTVADLAHTFGAREFVLVSTDKAVNPTSVMGASKRIAEIYVQALATRSETRFITVRFGNVLGSAGSVIPIFKEQIARGGPVTVTDQRMTRYFMTIPEACQLILQAAQLGAGGEIFVLDMGEPVKIVDLAHDLIRLSGLNPGTDIEIEFTGMRPGEKLYEELWARKEGTTATRHPKIFVGQANAVPLQRVTDWFEKASRSQGLTDDAWVRPHLKELVHEMIDTSSIVTASSASLPEHSIPLVPQLLPGE